CLVLFVWVWGVFVVLLLGCGVVWVVVLVGFFLFVVCCLLVGFGCFVFCFFVLGFGFGCLCFGVCGFG
ncbi:hypothetical protein RA266_28015, partial [Pseudomonas syringae pv. tagetis]|uniref:hypothetical protein n=1 Tax=Pseudomonas syringae group genomosp. 7 TaxID=251699 RepID=UPI0037700818